MTTTQIDITGLDENALNVVLDIALAGAPAAAINRLLAITKDATTLWAAWQDCLDDENSGELLRAAKALRIAIAVR